MLIMLTIFYTYWFCFQCWYSIKIIMNSHCTNKQCLLLEIVIISYKEMNYQAESNRVSITVISSTSVMISDGLILIPVCDSTNSGQMNRNQESNVNSDSLAEKWHSHIASSGQLLRLRSIMHLTRGGRTDIITVNSCRHGSCIHMIYSMT